MERLVKIGIMPHTGKKLALRLTQNVITCLEARNISPWVEPKAAAVLGREDLSPPDLDLASLDVLLVLGGDGTLLRAARKAAQHDLPLLGVNVGHLGFLTELETDNLELALAAIINKEYKIEERMLISSRVIREQQVVASYHALNDAVIARGTFARIIQLQTFVDEQPVVNYQADGLIVATPTGSTAYSLSAGGPIVEPQVECLIITPICPHTLAARSVVVSHDSVVKVLIEATHKDIMLTIDGQIGFPLQSRDVIEVVKADIKAKFVKLHGRNFFTILNNRLKTITTRKEYEDQ
ncbi:MAG: NAD(+)/NADH kinase [Firmicutes bacterium]|nr:NAD(+)/NADH kinase [Bacillota bacterium]